MTDVIEASDTDQTAEELRGALVDRIIARHAQLGMTFPDTAEAAMRKVPRHLFTPGATLAEAYADDSVITKREGGTNLSSVSAPPTVGLMLGLLDIRPGHRVLEIGSGGYNAALLAEIVGPTGSVTTMDIDTDVTDRATACLAATGYTDVRVLTADGEFGAPEYGPFDRIIVTVGAWDIPPAWREQLADGGRIVVPLRVAGITRAWALDRVGDHLEGRGPVMCGFVPMQGVGGHQGRSVPLAGRKVSLWTDEGQVFDDEALAGALQSPRAEAWSGVLASRGEPYDSQDLWLSGHLPGFAPLHAEQAGIDESLVLPSWRMLTPANVDGGTVAYRAKLRPVDGEPGRFEFGAYAHGPDAQALADKFAASIAEWDAAGRPAPELAVYPVDMPDADLPDGFVVTKTHTKIVISWPQRR